MFFRRKRNKDGTVLQLLESYRNAEGLPRHRVVVSLGDAQIDRDQWELIAKGVEKRLYAKDELFQWDYAEAVQRWIDRIVQQVDVEGRWGPLDKVAPRKARPTADGVLLDEIDHENSTALGPYLVGLHAWRELDLDRALEELGFNRAQRLAATATVLNRLDDSVSENATGEWIRTTALPDLLDSQLLKFKRDRFYRVSDRLLKHRRQIESHLRRRQRTLFSLKPTLFLYDLTNTYFEGEALANPKAKLGWSKEKRHDRPLLVVGMIFDENGFELGHEVFEGNRTDGPTLALMLERMDEIAREEAELFPKAQPTVVVDGGLASAKNLELLRKNNYQYFVNESRTGRGAYREHFLDHQGFEALPRRPGQSAVQIKVIADPQAAPDHGEADRLVLCRSAGRQDKEQAIRSKAETRLLEDLEGLAHNIAKGQVKEPKIIQRKIGRILGRHTRVARFYEVDIEPLNEPNKHGVSHKLIWKEKSHSAEEDRELLGCYAIRTSRQGLDAQTIWETYMTLTYAEEGFRTLKSHLGLRPNRHQIEPRADGHIFITIIAYHLLHHIRFKLRQQGDTRDWHTIKRLLSTHCYATIIVPTAKDGLHRIRKAGRPDHAQRAVYRALGVEWRNLPATRVSMPAR